MNKTRLEPSVPLALENGDEICFGTVIGKNEFKYTLTTTNGTAILRRKKRMRASRHVEQELRSLDRVCSTEVSLGMSQCSDTETDGGDVSQDSDRGPSQEDDLDLTPPLQKKPRLELDDTGEGALPPVQHAEAGEISCELQLTKAQAQSVQTRSDVATELLPSRAPVTSSFSTTLQHLSASCPNTPHITSSLSSVSSNQVSMQVTTVPSKQAAVLVSTSSHVSPIPLCTLRSTAKTPPTASSTSHLVSSSSAKPSPAMSHTSAISDEVDDLFDSIVKRSDSSLLDEAIFGGAEQAKPSAPVPGKKYEMDGATIQIMLAKNEMEQEKHHLLSSIEALKSELAAKNDVIAKKEEEVKVTGETVMSSMKEEFMCVICQELFIRAHTLSCSHSFCEWCIKNWLKSTPKKECPMCRVKITGDPVRSIVLDNAISKLEAKLSEEDQRERDKVKEEHRGHLGGTVKKKAGVNSSSSSVIVIGTPPRRTVPSVTTSTPIVLNDSSVSESSGSESDESESESDEDYRGYDYGYGGYGRCYNCGKGQVQRLGLGGVPIVCGECYITLGKFIGLLFLFCHPLLSILFLKTPKIRGMTSLAM